MKDKQKAELRRLAERSMRGGDHNEALMALRSFNTLASPAVVLSLLDENDRLRAEVEALRGVLVKARGRMADAKICFDRDYPDGWSGEMHLAVAMREIGNVLTKESSANG